MRKFYWILIIILPIGACTSIGKVLYGYRDLNHLDSNALVTWQKKQQKNGAETASYVDSDYVKYVISLSKDKFFRKAMFQFIVALSFDQDTCQSISSNCYFGGFPNIKWDNGSFDSFHPKNFMPDSICKKITLHKFLRLGNLMLDDNAVKNKTIVIICGNTFRRQSKRLVHLVNEKYPQCKRIILNNDNALYYLYSSSYLVKACF